MKRYLLAAFYCCSLPCMYTYSIVNLFVYWYCGKLLGNYENTCVIIAAAAISLISANLTIGGLSQKYDFHYLKYILILILYSLVGAMTDAVGDISKSGFPKDVTVYLKLYGSIGCGALLGFYISNKSAKKNSADSSTKQSEGRK